MDLKTPDGKPVGGVANKARKYKDFDIPIDEFVENRINKL